MKVPRFFVPQLRPGRIELPPAEARHAALVRRLRPGDAIELFDAEGAEATAQVVQADRAGVIALVADIRERPVDTATGLLTIAVAPPKGPRAEWMIEKLAELNAAAVWPIETDRSGPPPRDAKLEKWRRIAREANKQSGRAATMTIAAPLRLSGVIARLPEFPTILVGEPGANPLGSTAALDTADLLTAARRESPALALIGPEGGWTPAELSALLAAGATRIRLASHVLRIETAAVAIAAIFAFAHADAANSTTPPPPAAGGDRPA